MKIGYARVSTDEQNLDLQLLALREFGCDVVITDHGISGARFDRPGLNELLTVAVPGDTVVVWRLDRLGRSLSHLVGVVNDFRSRSIHFASLNEAIDTGNSAGMLMFHIIAALAEFERTLIGERTRAGMAAARHRGKQVGRPPSMNASQLAQACTLLETHSVEHVAHMFGISPRTLRRYCSLRADSGENTTAC